jgi:hypothetical protein
MSLERTLFFRDTFCRPSAVWPTSEGECEKPCIFHRYAAINAKKLSVGTSRVANTSRSAEKHFLDRQAQFALWHRVMPLFAH